MTARCALLALDCGGSNGRAALQHGNSILVRTVPGNLNPNDVGYADFEEGIASLAVPLIQAGLPGLRSIHVCAAVAGAANPLVSRMCTRSVIRALSRHVELMGVEILGDADAMVRAFLAYEDGIILIAGTGSVIVAVKHTGSTVTKVRVGGWGSFFDAGSGSRMGLGVLERVLEAHDGMRQAGTMEYLISKRYGIEIEQVPGLFLPVRRNVVSDLAAIALEAYAMGDAYARSIVRDSVDGLLRGLLAARRRAGLPADTHVIASGGLLRNDVFRRLFVRRLGRRLPKAKTVIVCDNLPHILTLAQPRDVHSHRRAG
jgi:N-acetylglucosamine kinase-like BadF-type ATPase